MYALKGKPWHMWCSRQKKESKIVYRSLLRQKVGFIEGAAGHAFYKGL